METVFINRTTPDHNLTYETVCFYNLYFISEQIYFSSELSFHIMMYNYRDKWPEKFLVEMLRAEHQNKEDGISEDDLNLMIKVMHKARSAKHKDKMQIQMLDHFRSMLVNQKNVIIIDFEERFQNVLIWPWIDLFDNETAVIVNYEDYRMNLNITANKQDHLIELLGDELIDKECKNDFLMLLPNVLTLKNARLVTDKNSFFKKTPDFYYFPVCQMPFIPWLTKENMKVVRNELLKKAQPFVNILKEFKSEAQKELFSDKIKDLALTYYTRILPETDVFQQSVDKQIYFMNAINAGKPYGQFAINAGICSINGILEYYRDAGIIQPFVFDALKKKLSMNNDINRCDVFLFLTELAAPLK